MTPATPTRARQLRAYHTFQQSQTDANAAQLLSISLKCCNLDDSTDDDDDTLASVVRLVADWLNKRGSSS